MAPRLVALLLLGLATTAHARTPRPPCQLGQFVTSAERRLAIGPAALAVETIRLDETTASISSGCPPTAATYKTTRRGTVVRATWPACAGAPGSVKLKATLRSRRCDLLRGVVTVKGARPARRKVRAARAPFAYVVALDPTSPWPKFRRTARQDGASPVLPEPAGGVAWVFPTGKGIFSTPVVDGDGTVYVGSADRTFYAIARDGTLRWSRLTGEIIDSAALLDDRGVVYVGSGDGNLYAFDRRTGDPVWTFAADPPSATGGLIDWFEGNVAIGRDGTLVVPNDNFRTYALARDDAAVRWAFATADQTWSLPAIDPVAGRVYMGNNNLLALLGDNTFALDAATGEPVWSHATDGSIAASPLLTRSGLVVLGGFDGFVRAYDAASGVPQWTFGARDHVYASPGELPDGTIVQPSADGSVYALDPATGAVRWQFDTRDAIRSSPAIDGAGNVYVGAGDGRLYVVNRDGTLRWSIRLIDDRRDDLNASPALGPDAILVAGESGEVFSVPYDWCLRDAAAGDARCRRGPAEDLPDDVAAVYFTTPFGRPLEEPPATIERNQPLAFTLFVREGGDTVLAHVDSSALAVTVTPPVPVRTEVSGDRKFVTVVPLAPWAGDAGGAIAVDVEGPYLVDPDRVGLKFSGGTVGGTFAERFEFTVAPVGADDALPLPVPAAPGDPAGVWDLSRVATPLPTILPSYNQIGFDSIHYLVGLVEQSAPGRAIAWVVGGRLATGANATVVDPATRVLFPVTVTHDGGALTLQNETGFAIEFNAFRIPLPFFRLAGRLDATGAVPGGLAMNVSAICAGITVYGPFLQQLGFCNPQTDVLSVFGGAELRPLGSGVQQPPAGLGTVDVVASPTGVTATFTGSTLRTDEHAIALLLLDDGTGEAVPIDYGFATVRTPATPGPIESVHVPFDAVVPPPTVRAYVMVDAYPAVRRTLVVP